VGSPRVLGLDPGFANVGFVRLRLDAVRTGLRVEWQPVVEDAGLLWTEKSDKKRKVLAADDNTRRAREMTRALTTLLLDPTTGQVGVQAICAEAMSYPRNASSSAKIALTWGVIIALAETHGLPIVQASPQEVKLALCGRKDASKDDIRAASELRFGADLAGKMHDQHGAKLGAKADLAHPFDAIASAYACLNSEVIRGLRRAA